MPKFTQILKGLRIPLYWASGAIILLSYALAFKADELRRPLLWAIASAALIVFEIGVNLVSELHDLVNHVPITQRRALIPTGPYLAETFHLNAGRLEFYSGISLIIAALLGFYVAANTGYTVILSIGAVGVLLVLLYAIPPFRLGERVYGEVVPFLSFGPLPMAALFYTISGSITPFAMLLSLPNAFWVTAIRFVHHMPDTMHSADRTIQRNYQFKLRNSIQICTFLLSAALILLIPSTVIAGIAMLPALGVAVLLSVFAMSELRKQAGSAVKLSEKTVYLLLLQFASTLLIALGLML